LDELISESTITLIFGWINQWKHYYTSVWMN